MTDRAIEEAYRKGFRDGATAFAWWKDGEQQVGTTGKTLRTALEEIDRGDVWNYAPPRTANVRNEDPR